MIGFLSKKVLTFPDFSSIIRIIRRNVILQILNQYSFFFAGLLLLLLTGAALAWRRRGLRLREAGLLVLVAGLIGLGWLASRPAKVSAVDAAQIRAQIGQGTPLLLEFQSPYCLACANLNASLDRIERQYAGRLIVLRVDVTQPAGRSAAQELGFQYTPTFIFFSANGDELWRNVGSLDENQILSSVSP